MKILITGIHGFVGTNLVKELSKEHEIYGLDIVAPNLNGVIKTFLWEDLQNDYFPNVDAIIHLAGKAHDTKKQSSSDIYFKINTGLTERIFDFFLKSSTAKRFIFFSSVKAAADKVDGDILTEDIVPKPVGPYGESKIKAEEYIKKHYDFSSPNVKKVYIFRPCMIHGPGNKGNLNLLFSVVSKGVPYPLGAYENKRSFTSIANLQFVIKNLLIKDIQSGIYNIADDEPLSTNELISIISKTLNKKEKIWKIPKVIVNICSKVCDVIHGPLTSERLVKLTENYIVSNKKIKNALGVENLPVHAKDGLVETIKSFIRNG